MLNALNVFDCSNSVARPEHRGGGGPVQNDVMRQLKTYGGSLGLNWVTDLAQAEVVMTNDVFTTEALDCSLPRVKRMDGVFFLADALDRNTVLNAAATQADHVVFISEFSRQSLRAQYPDVRLKSESVALNAADPTEFPCRGEAQLMASQKRLMSGRLRWAACATHWGRDEKRFSELVHLAELRPHDTFVLIGTPPAHIDIPANFDRAGYCTAPQQIAAALQACDAYVHLAYQDAAPKTVAQALAVGLPVLYAASGGIPELVGTYGVAVPDASFDGLRHVPSLPRSSLWPAASMFIAQLSQLSLHACNFPSQSRFDQMLQHYAQVLHQFA